MSSKLPKEPQNKNKRVDQSKTRKANSYPCWYFKSVYKKTLPARIYIMRHSNDLSAEFSEMKDVSQSTLSLKLKKKLNFSYKKVGWMNMTRADKCDKNNKISCTKLILGLVEDDYHVMF